MLRAFSASDFPQLSAWVTSADLLFQFSANTFPFPLSYADMEAYSLANPDRQFYMAADAEIGDYGFGEIIPQAGNVPRLGRLLIGKPELRGKGLGKKMVSLLLDECKSHGHTGVELYVLNNNYNAIKCYEGLGFTYLDADLEIEFGGVIEPMKKMRVDF